MLMCIFLPSNPFYFLKELRRDMRKILAFKEIRKLELEIETANEKAAELRKMEEITPDNHEALADAIENYNGQLELKPPSARYHRWSTLVLVYNPCSRTPRVVDDLFEELTKNPKKEQKTITRAFAHFFWYGVLLSIFIHEIPPV